MCVRTNRFPIRFTDSRAGSRLGPNVRFSGARALARTCVSALIDFQSDLPILELGAAWGQMFDFGTPKSSAPRANRKGGTQDRQSTTPATRLAIAMR